jgi:hypothetical protein
MAARHVRVLKRHRQLAASQLASEPLQQLVQALLQPVLVILAGVDGWRPSLDEL